MILNNFATEYNFILSHVLVSIACRTPASDTHSSTLPVVMSSSYTDVLNIPITKLVFASRKGIWSCRNVQTRKFSVTSRCSQCMYQGTPLPRWGRILFKWERQEKGHSFSATRKLLRIHSLYEVGSTFSLFACEWKKTGSHFRRICWIAYVRGHISLIQH